MGKVEIGYFGLNTSLLINSHIAIMTINKSKDQKTSFKEAYMNLLLRIFSAIFPIELQTFEFCFCRNVY